MTDYRKLLIEAREAIGEAGNPYKSTEGSADFEKRMGDLVVRIDAALAEKVEPVALNFLDRDNDGHWYVVQESKRAEWEKWLQIPSDDQASWDVPDFAEPVGGSPNTVSFYTTAPADQWRRVEDGLPHTDHPMRHYDRTCPACNPADQVNVTEDDEALKIGKRWLADSSLETWFPFTAEELARLRAKAADQVNAEGSK